MRRARRPVWVLVACGTAVLACSKYSVLVTCGDIGCLTDGGVIVDRGADILRDTAVADQPNCTRCGDACVDLSSDPAHCGGCSISCNGLPCDQGHCGCGVGSVSCGTRCVRECMNIGLDPRCLGPLSEATCHDSRVVCPQIAAGQSCNRVDGEFDGICSAEGRCVCRAGEVVCGGSCRAVDSHEGCGAGQICRPVPGIQGSQGYCACSVGSYASPDGGCVACTGDRVVSTDGMSCVQCMPRQVVIDGGCHTCEPNQHIVDGGCVTCGANSILVEDSCIPCGTHQMARGTSCVECTSRDAGCTPCPTGMDPVNAGMQCCATNSICSGTCVNLTTDHCNCGSCGQQCAGTCSRMGCMESVGCGGPWMPCCQGCNGGRSYCRSNNDCVLISDDRAEICVPMTSM